LSIPDRLGGAAGAGHEDSAASARGLSEAAVSRLALCHRVLLDLAAAGVESVRSDDLAAACGVRPANLRKDLSCLGSYGVRGVGYQVPVLLTHIAEQLGLTSGVGVVIVGLGHLGRALAGYPGFTARGLTVVGLIDSAGIGDVIECPSAPLAIAGIGELDGIVQRTGARIGIIATPAASAQQAADLLVASGVRSILNFAPATLAVPASIEVRRVDLAVELQILAFHEQQRAEETA